MFKLIINVYTLCILENGYMYNEIPETQSGEILNTADCVFGRLDFS